MAILTTKKVIRCGKILNKIASLNSENLLPKIAS